jgi:predicted nucleic acid-binding protein
VHSWLATTARSDSLPELLGFVGPALEQLGIAGVRLRLRVVLDTSAILADLHWMVARRRNPAARTDLLEAINAKVVVACVPPHVEQEVRDNLPQISEKTGASVEALWALWLDYKRLLTFVEPKPVENPAIRFLQGRDPKDIPFVQASETIAAVALLTKDRHLLDADARSLKPHEIVVDLRNYARAKTVELTIAGLGTFTLGTSVHVLVAAVRSLPAVGRAIARLPWWLHLIAAGGVLWVLSSSDRRDTAKRVLQRVRDFCGDFGSAFVEQAKELFVVAMDHHQRARVAEDSVLAKVKPRRIRLCDAVYLACAEARRAQSIDEIERAVRDLGYVSKAKSLQPSIRRTLRGDRRFVVTATDHWTIRSNGAVAAAATAL